jgi:Holliday junction DNA helicase RuvA
MIAHLKGQLTYKSPVHCIVDVNGVGYKVFTPLSTYYALPGQGESVSLRIYTRVREDELKLFGFLTEEEQTIFEKLITINKVGPKLALGILSGMSPADLITAVMNKDAARLSSIPGVGKKTAERLALELKDKLADLAIDMQHQPDAAQQDGFYEDALSALVNLGYKKPQAENALKSVYNEDRSLEDLIKESLNNL